MAGGTRERAHGGPLSATRCCPQPPGGADGSRGELPRCRERRPEATWDDPSGGHGLCADGADPGVRRVRLQRLGADSRLAVPAATPAAASEPLPAAPTETALLDAVFRIDVERVEAAFDIYPAERRVQAQAAVTFRMRPGQSRPIIHFEPARRRPGSRCGWTARTSIPPGRATPASSRTRDRARSRSSCSGTSPRASPHRLEASYPLALADAGGRFFADVNDIDGNGNEALFPTLNVPHELARHVLVFRVHAAEPYLGVGSGLVTARAAGDVQEWVLDTEREVASYTVMFHLAPARSHLARERRVRAWTCASSRQPAASPRRRPSRFWIPGSGSCRGRSAPSRCRAASASCSPSRAEAWSTSAPPPRRCARCATRSSTCTTAAARWRGPTATPGGTRPSTCGTSSRPTPPTRRSPRASAPTS